MAIPARLTSDGGTANPAAAKHCGPVRHRLAILRSKSSTAQEGAARKDHAGPPPISCVRASEVERQPGRHSPDCCAADRVVIGVAATELIAMPARAKAVVRTLVLREFCANEVPACPLVEAVF